MYTTSQAQYIPVFPKKLQIPQFLKHPVLDYLVYDCINKQIFKNLHTTTRDRWNRVFQKTKISTITKAACINYLSPMSQNTTRNGMPFFPEIIITKKF